MNSKCTLQTCSGRASIGKTVPWSLALLLAAVAVSSALLWRPMRLHSASTPYANLNGFLPTRANINPPPNSAPEGMVWIPGGEFSMGSADPRTLPHGGGEAMDDARPIHRVYVDGLWMDKTDVTNAQFARFVKATGYKTIAERKPQPKDFPGAAANDLVPGSIVFTPPSHSVPLDDYSQWWRYVPGADWQHPLGPHSSIRGREQYPVVQIAYEDAAAYAKWAGSDYRPKLNGNLPPAAALPGNHLCGAIHLRRITTGWPIHIRETSPTVTMQQMDLPGSHRLHSTAPMATGSMTCRATYGNGPATGIDRTITHGSRRTGWPAIRKVLHPQSIPASQAYPNASNAEAHFSVRINTAPVISSAHEVRGM